MPFEVAPEVEQQTREQLGRIALEAIAAHILTVPPEHFNMGKWCGSACCAIGNSIALPAVAATGLYLDEPDFSNLCQSHYPAFAGKREDFLSIAKAFGIPLDAAEHLFDGHAYQAPANWVSAGEVSARIREYLAT